MYVKSIKSKDNINTMSDCVFASLVALFFCHYTLFGYIEIIIGKIPYLSIFRHLFFPTMYFILILFSYKRIRVKYIRKNDYFIISFFAISILITSIVYPNNVNFIVSSLNSHILPCVPFYILGLCFYADRRTLNTVSKYSCLSILISVVYVFYYISSGRNLGGEDGGYSMYWSYLLLPNIMIVIDYTFREKKPFAIICSVIGLIYAFAMGTRGPIVILFFFIAILMWTNLKISTKKKSIISIVMAILLTIFFRSPVYLEILVALKLLFIANGVSTRVVDYLVSGNMVSYTSGRTEIFQDLIQKLSERPMLGYGVYGEWPLGYYSAHNMYIEILFHFGVIVGFILSISYILLFIKALKISNNTLAKRWIIMFGCLVFVKGIFGGRYMEYSVFFLLGLCLREIRSAKKQQPCI